MAETIEEGIDLTIEKNDMSEKVSLHACELTVTQPQLCAAEQIRASSSTIYSNWRLLWAPWQKQGRRECA
eukprot:2835985-Amphidinium_carterae.1